MRSYVKYINSRFKDLQTHGSGNNSHQNKNTGLSKPIGTSGIRNRDTNGITGSGDNSLNLNKEKPEWNVKNVIKILNQINIADGIAENVEGYMKIIDHFINQEEPQDCDSCGKEWNAKNIIKLELFDEFNLEFSLCDDCFGKLKTQIHGKGKRWRY